MFWEQFFPLEKKLLGDSFSESCGNWKLLEIGDRDHTWDQPDHLWSGLLEQCDRGLYLAPKWQDLWDHKLPAIHGPGVYCRPGWLPAEEKIRRNIHLTGNLHVMGNYLHQQRLSDGSYGTEQSVINIQKNILKLTYIGGQNKTSWTRYRWLLLDLESLLL